MCINANKLTDDSGSNVLCAGLWSSDVEADRFTHRDWTESIAPARHA